MQKKQKDRIVRDTISHSQPDPPGSSFTSVVVYVAMRHLTVLKFTEQTKRLQKTRRVCSVCCHYEYINTI